MTLIDQRILVPAPIQAVWGVLANHSQLPRWRQDCKAVSVLSTRSEGVGMRRRITPIHGKDLIEEMIAWYEGLGYEYHLIEGGNKFKSYSARLRLQAVPEGTIVQWTIAFETRGPLGKLFNNRPLRRKLEKAATESLRQLRRYIEGLGIRVDEQYREKMGIRSSPDANSRQEYGAKLTAQQQTQTPPAQSGLLIETPPPPTGTQPTQPAQSTGGISIIEPPIKPEDTPSIRPVAPPSFIVEALMTPVPPIAPAATGQAEKRKTQEAPLIAVDKDEDTKPNPAVVVDKPVAATNVTVLPAIITDKKSAEVVSTKKPDTASPVPGLTKPEDIKAALSTDKVSMPSLRPTKIDEADDLPIRPDLPPPSGKLDTGEMSIWDVFGVKAPRIEPATETPSVTKSEPTTIETPVPATLPESVVEAAATTPKAAARDYSLDAWLAANEPPLPSSATGTIKTFARVPQRHNAGLRLRQRQRRLKVRPPKSPENPNGNTALH